MTKLADILTFSETRARLKDVMDRVTEDRAPVTVTRKGRESVVMVSITEWTSIQETLHLLRSPANARRLRDAIEDADRGAPGAVITAEQIRGFAEDPASFAAWLDDECRTAPAGD